MENKLRNAILEQAKVLLLLLLLLNIVSSIKDKI
jgi:hypothetical protein